MRKRRGTAVRALGIAMALLALAVCGAADTGRGEGVVTGLATAEGRVTIEHGDIPGLMQAMTMTFAVADPELLEGLAVGDAVAFEVLHAEGRYTVTALERR